MNKRFLCWVLALSLAFQPLIFEGICWAQEAASPDAGSGSGTAADQAKQAEEIQKQFEETYQKIMAMEEIKNPSKGGIGGFLKGLALKVTGKKKEVDEAVNKANEEMKKMKEDMTKLRAELAAGVSQAKAASVQDAQAAMQKQLEAAAKIKTEVSQSMRKVGEMLNNLSGTIKKVAGVLAGIAGVVAVIPVIGTAVSGVLFTVATVLGRVSSVVGVAGKAMITFSDKADISAADFAKTIGEAKDAWKKGGDEFKRPTSTKGDDKSGKGGTAKKDGKDGKTPATDNDGTVKVDPKEKVTVPTTTERPITDKKDKPDTAGVGKISVPGGSDDDSTENGEPPAGNGQMTNVSWFGSYPRQYAVGQNLEQMRDQEKAEGGIITGTDLGGSTEFTYAKTEKNTKKVSIRTKEGRASDYTIDIWVAPDSHLDHILNASPIGTPRDNMWEGVTVQPLPKPEGEQ